MCLPMDRPKKDMGNWYLEGAKQVDSTRERKSGLERRTRLCEQYLCIFWVRATVRDAFHIGTKCTLCTHTHAHTHTYT
jgi:hypothetical protein